MKVWLAIFVAAWATGVAAQDLTLTSPSGIVTFGQTGGNNLVTGYPASAFTSSGNYTLGSLSPSYFSFTCADGQVSVSLKDGSVKFTGGCTPDEGARAFWRAVEALYPVRNRP